jgi:large subunit ribosomal protein L10
MITKDKKRKIVEELLENITKAKAIYFTAFSGLDVAKISQLRDNLRQLDTKAKVAKKTLADLSFQKAGFNLNILNKKDQFNNSIMLEFAFGDPILSAKTIWQFSKQNENSWCFDGW